jgi:hypothetical protein
MKLRVNGGGKMVCVIKVNGMGLPNIFTQTKLVVKPRKWVL